MRPSFRCAAILVALAVAASCGDDVAPGTDGGGPPRKDAAVVGEDAGPGGDGSVPPDGGGADIDYADTGTTDAATPDAGHLDAGAHDAGGDAGAADTGHPSGDAGVDADGQDSGPNDAGQDSGHDAGLDGGPDAGTSIDPTTMAKKLLMGYQGWFYCPGDGSPTDGWVHWFRSQTPDPQNATFDLWPDTSDLDADELFATNMTIPGGAPAMLYSAWTLKTVVRHFAWMEAAGIDGVLLQRFASELGDPRFFAARNQVTQNVRAGAEQHGRVFAIEYDISGMTESTIVDVLKKDWAYLVDTLKVTESPRYLHHNGRPVLFVWGFGFGDRPGTPAQAAEVVAWFKTGAQASQRVTLVGGVPTYWRTLTNDSKTDQAWAGVYRSFDVVNPWAVGRYADDNGADGFKKNLIAPDLAECNARGIEYMPVIFPGFSWHNLFPQNPPNQIPRRGGDFYWRQAYNAIGAGASMIFNAMFDEVDEGTAMARVAPSASAQPAQGTFVPLDIDGETLPSDWYLRLGGEASRMLRGERPLTATIPIAP